jgi:hypothetical protein
MTLENSCKNTANILVFIAKIKRTKSPLMKIIVNLCSPAWNVNTPHTIGQQHVFQNFQ